MTVEVKSLTMTVEELAIFLSMSLSHTYQQLYARNIPAYILAANGLYPDSKLKIGLITRRLSCRSKELGGLAHEE